MQRYALHSATANSGLTALVTPCRRALSESSLPPLSPERHSATSVVKACVTVVETPTTFSPFPSTDCTLYSHFSFDDFVMIAFLDLTRDLDDQI